MENTQAGFSYSQMCFRVPTETQYVKWTENQLHIQSDWKKDCAVLTAQIPPKADKLNAGFLELAAECCEREWVLSASVVQSSDEEVFFKTPTSAKVTYMLNVNVSSTYRTLTVKTTLIQVLQHGKINVASASLNSFVYRLKIK